MQAFAALAQGYNTADCTSGNAIVPFIEIVANSGISINVSVSMKGKIMFIRKFALSMIIAALMAPTATYAQTGAPASIDTVSINGRVCTDMNGDGVCQKNEPGVAGATVEATEWSVETTFTVTTDAEGKYHIGGLERGFAYDMSVYDGTHKVAGMDNVRAPHNACDLEVAPKVLYLPLMTVK